MTVQSTFGPQTMFHIFSSTEVQISHRNLCHLIGGYTKHSQTKIEFVQTTGQAVMHASQWLKLEHCSSTSRRLHGLVLPARHVKSKDYTDFTDFP